MARSPKPLIVSLHPWLIAASVAVLAAIPAHAETFSLIGYLHGRGVTASGPPTWIEGGFGRLGSRGEDAFAVAQLGADWEPSPYFDAHVQGIARSEQPDAGGKRAGLVEAYFDVRGFTANDEIQLRAGQFFLPTSRENTGQFWTSPYLISWSAINSWIAEEFRPVGADLQWRHTFPNQHALSVAGTAFRDNDTSGALLAWRGWSVGNRLSVYDEVLPLPPLFSLRDTGGFADQRDGTVPFERDLDGRTGFAFRARYSVPDRVMVQLTHVDNRGSRDEYGDEEGVGVEYAWATKFDQVGLELGSQDATTLAAEYMRGKTGMGEPPGATVDADFYAAYLLVSHRFTKTRISARFDRFAMLERDFSQAESNTEHGRAWALAWFYYPAPHWRAGAELTQVTGRRLAAEQSGFDGSTDAHALTVEVRYNF